MQFTFKHTNFNVLDLQRSMDFYKEALGLTEVRRIENPDFTIVYLGDGVSDRRGDAGLTASRLRRSSRRGSIDRKEVPP